MERSGSSYEDVWYDGTAVKDLMKKIKDVHTIKVLGLAFINILPTELNCGFDNCGLTLASRRN